MAALARTILITGASRGIGLEMVKQLSKSSPPPEVLVAGCRDPSTSTALQDIAQENNFVKIVKLDVESDSEIDAAVKETESLVGEHGLNLLINNAGIYLGKEDGGSVRKQTRERLQRHFNVNTTSPIIVTQKFLPLLELAASSQSSLPLGCRKAACVVTSSNMGSQTAAYESGKRTCLDYQCSKSAVNMATIMMSQDLKDVGILVMAIHPGWVQTDMGYSIAPLTPHESVEGIFKVLGGAGEKDMGRMVSYNGEVLRF